ncbi:IS1634 family transposase [Paenibacillus sp. IB182496]|uniref:IS1634 family transposase n=1 Tax=Paenibacillus sabuli TaxID=2772509 RepID=A0A927BXG5_9BACL|nr:IS1634 family transposase [Paenibacillus sabuli]MBD2848683.1 IS1634 family transposase [Paenibacillus sabuli]
MEIERVYEMGYLPLVCGIMKQLGLRKKIDQLVPVDPQCRTSAGEAVQLLVLDILSGRNALVHVDKWAAQLDLDALVRPGLQAAWFNDDALGRHLDRLHEADIHAVYSAFQLQVYQHERIPMGVFHGDTTSMSVYGAYTKPSETLQIVEGYSRDRRGAKQIQLGLIGNTDGIPLYGDVHDGNTSDKTWNPEVLEKLHAQCAAAKLDDFLYVADSAAMSTSSLDAAKRSGAYLLTRVPNHLKIVKAALAAADAEATTWTENVRFVTSKEGATYRWFATEAEHEGHSLRLIVVESSALDKKKEKTLTRAREQEAGQLEQAAKEAAHTPWHCRADAERAAETFRREQASRFHHVEVDVVSQDVVRKKRGRPKKGETPQVDTVYALQITVSPDDARFEEARRRTSRFVLGTTLPMQWRGERRDGTALLGLYKGQIQVEMNFSFLKDPVYTDEIYLKKPERVKVLGYLFLLALTIYRVFQRRIRQHITEQKPMRGAGGRILRKPTAAAIFQIFTYRKTAVLRLPDGTRLRQIVGSFSQEERRVLRSLGLDESVYLG